jgi:pimeloyl-ACP methyl ester carboxylesterase
MIRQVRSLNVNDTLAIVDQIPNLNVPARLVWGAADQFQKIGYGYRLAYELGASIERIEGGKHFVPEDHPERVAAAVNALLEQTVPDR